MLKRAGFARAIVTRPELVLYDEPTTGLDPIITNLITDTIVRLRAKLNGTAVVISHDLAVDLRDGRLRGDALRRRDHRIRHGRPDPQLHAIRSSSSSCRAPRSGRFQFDAPTLPQRLFVPEGKYENAMTRQAQVGAFAIVAMLLLFGVFYVITDFGTRHTGYRVGIHFQSAAGVTSGALVYFSGVDIGSVDSIELLPDNTVDVILAMNRDIDIPAASRFLIQAPLTGSPSVIIVPPPRRSRRSRCCPARCCRSRSNRAARTARPSPICLQQGQGEIKRFDTVMAQIEARTPKLLNTLQTTLDNANDLTVTTKSSLQRLSGELLAMGSNLQGSLTAASTNVVQLSTTLNGAATTDSKKVGALLDQFQSTSIALNRSMNALQELATDPRLKANVLTTTESIAETTQNLAVLTKDLRTVTDDPQTQAQVRDTIANLDAVMQKANSLLGQLGGTSSVPGVDTRCDAGARRERRPRRDRCTRRNARPAATRFHRPRARSCTASSRISHTISSRSSFGSAASRRSTW